MNTITRRIAAGFAAASLSVALVSCSEAEDAANKAGEGAEKATDAAGDAAGSATEAAGSEKAETEKDNQDNQQAGGEMKKISTPAGEVEVPAAFASAIDEKKAEWGEVQNVENGENGSLATFAEDKLLAFSEESGAQPVIGKIAETWKNEGGLAAKAGLPVEAEQVATEGEGWTQKFTNGTISWLKGESGQFEPSFN